MTFGGLEESDRAMKMLQQLAFPGQQVKERKENFTTEHEHVHILNMDKPRLVYAPCPVVVF